MLKRLIVISFLGLAGLAPVVSAQTPALDPGATPKLRAAAASTGKAFRRRVGRGVRLGTIAPADRAALHGKVHDLRTKFQALRQNGQRPTRAQRQEFRQGVMKLRQDFLATHRVQ
jgi:hypothetical protein